MPVTNPPAAVSRRRGQSDPARRVLAGGLARALDPCQVL